ncbi:hypothetical protein ZWY2020_033463 [Hordeum vulgare]|nr:hypothetical protein ZWY2020_015102 [Hordeum vulgare]KAI5006220.1 hypothetical protein ZWY2020_033463 [Hordeum vulgare]
MRPPPRWSKIKRRKRNAELAGSRWKQSTVEYSGAHCLVFVWVHSPVAPSRANNRRGPRPPTCPPRPPRPARAARLLAAARARAHLGHRVPRIGIAIPPPPSGAAHTAGRVAARPPDAAWPPPPAAA